MKKYKAVLESSYYGANDIGNSMVECPICHARSDYDVKSIKRGYCWKCGQKLDWSE